MIERSSRTNFSLEAASSARDKEKRMKARWREDNIEWWSMISASETGRLGSKGASQRRPEQKGRYKVKKRLANAAQI